MEENSTVSPQVKKCMKECYNTIKEIVNQGNQLIEKAQKEQSTPEMCDIVYFTCLQYIADTLTTFKSVVTPYLQSKDE